MSYFEEDTQLRDILITGGDALMSQNQTLEKILDAVFRMAVRKRELNSKSGTPGRRKIRRIATCPSGIKIISLPTYAY